MAGRETPATKAARAAGIAFEVLEYGHDEAATRTGSRRRRGSGSIPRACSRRSSRGRRRQWGWRAAGHVQLDLRSLGEARRDGRPARRGARDRLRGRRHQPARPAEAPPHGARRGRLRARPGVRQRRSPRAEMELAPSDLAARTNADRAPLSRRRVIRCGRTRRPPRRVTELGAPASRPARPRWPARALPPSPRRSPVAPRAGKACRAPAATRSGRARRQEPHALVGDAVAALPPRGALSAARCSRSSRP